MPFASDGISALPPGESSSVAVRNLHAIFRHQQRMLKLCSQLTVRRHRGPVVRPRLVSIRAQRDHGLDGESHAGLSLADGFILRVMRDIRGGVEDGIDAMAAVCLDDLAASRFCDFLDRIFRSRGTTHRVSRA